jgi:hypothetical protein
MERVGLHHPVLVALLLLDLDRVVVILDVVLDDIPDLVFVQFLAAGLEKAVEYNPFPVTCSIQVNGVGG